MWSSQPKQSFVPAIAAQIQPTNSGIQDENSPPYVSNFQLVPTGSSYSNAFSGSQVMVDFPLSKTLGKIVEMNLQFDLKVTGDASANYVLSCSPYFVDRIDFMIDGSVLETQYADTLFAETVTFQTDQDLYTSAPLMGVNTEADSAGYPKSAGFRRAGFQIQRSLPEGSGEKTVNHTFWLPLAGFLPSAQPFLKGLRNSDVVVRVYLTKDIRCGTSVYTPLPTTTAFVTGASVNVTLKNLQLWGEEASVSREADEALVNAHSSGINYRSVLRTVWTRQAQMTVGSADRSPMNALNGISAGVLIYLKSSSTDPTVATERMPVTSLQLFDQNSAQMTQVLPAQLVESVITPSATPIASYFINSPVYTSYVLPFCSSLERARYGKVLGARRLSGLEQVSLVPAPWGDYDDGESLSVQEVAVSWDYATIHVSGNRVQSVAKATH